MSLHGLVAQKQIEFRFTSLRVTNYRCDSGRRSMLRSRPTDISWWVGRKRALCFMARSAFGFGSDMVSVGKGGRCARRMVRRSCRTSSARVFAWSRAGTTGAATICFRWTISGIDSSDEPSDETLNPAQRPLPGGRRPPHNLAGRGLPWESTNLNPAATPRRAKSAPRSCRPRRCRSSPSNKLGAVHQRGAAWDYWTPRLRSISRASELSPPALRLFLKKGLAGPLPSSSTA